MTERLYYDDSYTTHFPARVVERLTVGDHPAVVLDRTYFYPEGGGQPADRGTIAGVEVLDVLTREGDYAVLHVLSSPVGEEEVSCEVDWNRRFDHMQQHTGQHILTQAFVQTAGANTIGFHLSSDRVTIDLDKGGLKPETIDAVEDLVNRVIYENRPVAVETINPDDIDGVRMRKMPDALVTDGLRVIEVSGFDRTACGGTHVAHTGEIGLIKIVKLEKYKDGTRVEFCCGWRALHDLRLKNEMVNRLAADFSVGFLELDEAVTRLKAELKETRRALKAATDSLMQYEAGDLLASARLGENGVQVIRRAFDGRDPGELRSIASRLVESPGVLVLLGTSGEKSQLVLARSADLTQDMAVILKQALAALGDARGGGRPDFAQGGGVRADLAAVEAALETAEKAALRRD